MAVDIESVLSELEFDILENYVKISRKYLLARKMYIFKLNLNGSTADNWV